jgi:hypothetical protein
MNPFSFRVAVPSVNGAQQSVRPADFAADSAMAEQINTLPRSCAGNSTAPNAVSNKRNPQTATVSVVFWLTLATKPLGSMVTVCPLFSTTIACGVQFTNCVLISVISVMFFKIKKN